MAKIARLSRSTPPWRKSASARAPDDYVAALSSGMKCRLSIAKWPLLQPDLLLLDEPYGVLDGSGIDLLETFLKRQCAQRHHRRPGLAPCLPRPQPLQPRADLEPGS